MDRLLRRSLTPADPGPASGSCLSAEQVAAWVDGALPPHEREAAEAHAAGCDRCLALVAATARTIPHAEKTAWWQSLLRARWLVPVTAAAAALTLWVAVDRRQVSDVASPESTLAERLTGPAPEPAQPPPGTEQKALAPPEPAPEQQEREATGRRESRAREADTVPPTAQYPAERRRADRPAPSAPAAKEEQQRVAKDASAASPQAVTSEPGETAAAAAPERSYVPTTITMHAQLRQNVATPALEVHSPDPQVRWRVAADTIQRSVDGGLSWEAQTSTGGVSLLAGAAPSSTVCWFAGRGGAVFVTADGVNWRRVTVPASEDLTAIAAEDARAATVTTVTGAVYRTSDGGATWVVQEAPAPSF